MGSGASSLTNEQKAAIAKEMKEKYESIDPAEQPTAQSNLMKHYEELVAKAQESKPAGLAPGKKKKNRFPRMCSFENGQFLLVNVAHPTKKDDSQEQENQDRK